ncbi:MAG: acetyl-CoA carboxylase biotin carboxyl carrier protein [Bacteroidota bacterium]|jgi:acetyl-CoA carboxylase biotin carboxyl carrier protein
MELKEIQDLIRFVAKSGVSEVELESKGFKIVIKTGNAQEIIRVAEPTVIHAQVPVASAPAPVAPAPVAPAAPIAAAPVANDSSKYVTIKSPMIGTFYRSSGPGKPLFVNVGDEITAGKAVCIIEAMKLFNEIESEISGTIVKVLVNDATPVEYDQPLFLVEPK